MASDPVSSGSLWQLERPDEKLGDLRSRFASFVPAYEEMLECTGGEIATAIHTRRLTPIGCALQVFESEAFFVASDQQVRGVMKFYCTETIDAIGETPTSYFYQLYRNAGPQFELIGRRVLEYHAEHSDPLDPRNSTLSGLYGNASTALMHVTSCELRDDFRGEHRVVELLRSVEDLRVRGIRHLIHPDNPYRANGAPASDQVEAWEARYDEEIAVQLARRIGYLTISTQPADQIGAEHLRLRAYIDTVADELANDERPVLVVDDRAGEGQESNRDTSRPALP